MSLATTFVPLLQFLASQSLDDPAAGQTQFQFEIPSPAPQPGELAAFDMSEVGTGVTTRICCALGGIDSDSVNVTQFPSKPHRYRKAGTFSMLPGGDLIGYVYTRRGGLIDLGHARDFIDYTRFFAVTFDTQSRHGRAADAPTLFNEGGDVHLVITPQTVRPSSALSALVGAKLAYDRAVWHEISTYFPPGPLEVDERFSSFSPEDNFSNAVGALAGYRACLATKTLFDAAADDALIQVLDDLGPALKEDTDTAVKYVKDSWWDGTIPLNPKPSLLRRNFDVFPPKPWLVTDIQLAGKEAVGAQLRATLGRPKPANIDIPAFLEVIVLDSLAHLEITNIKPELSALLTRQNVAINGVIKSSNLPAVVQAIRAQEIQDKGAGADSPGPPVP